MTSKVPDPASKRLKGFVLVSNKIAFLSILSRPRKSGQMRKNRAYFAYMRKYLNLRTNIALGLIFAFLANTVGPIPLVQADEFRLPAPGVMVHLSPEFNPPILKGIKVNPANPLRFDFI